MPKKRTMILARIYGFVSAVAISGGALAEGHLEATLSVPAVRDPHRPAMINLQLRNTGDEPVSVMKWDTPFAESGGRLPKPIFTVLDDAGAPAPYRGSYVNFGRVEMGSFLHIGPGEVLEGNVDLLHEYNYGNGGTFTVSYELDLGRQPDADVVPAADLAAFRSNQQVRVTSNPVVIRIDAPVKEAVASADEDECDGNQSLSILNAKYKSVGVVLQASNFLKSLHVQPPRHSMGAMSPGRDFRPHARYSRWFGEYDTTEPGLGNPGWGIGNNAQAYDAMDALLQRVMGNSGGALMYKCGCPGYGPDVAAHAVVDTKYVMYFCDKFFSLPEQDPFSSRIGVIIHEYTHFNDIHAGRSDYVYGQANAQELARNDRWKAVRNADNFEFFVTDTRPDRALEAPVSVTHDLTPLSDSRAN